MGFAAINAEDHAGSDGRITESVEAQESRIADAYAAGLKYAEMGRRTEAQAVFEGLLHEGLLHAGNKGASISAASAAQLRYLVLKNLASLLAAEDASAPRALSLYAQALMLDDGDSVVWNHMGTLAAELGRWGVARTIFEHGLRRHPGRAVMAEKLAEVVMQLGDWQAAQPILARMLARDPAHPRALQLSELVKAVAASLAHQGDGLEAHASPFRKRVPAAGPSTDRQAGTTVLSARIATWSALLCAVTNMLRAPRASPAGQIMHSLCMTISPEHRQPVLGEDPSEDRDMGMAPMGEAHPAVEGIPVSAAQNAEAVAGPAAAQLPGAEALPLQPSGPNVVVQPTHDRKRSLQLEHSLGHAPQKGNRDSSEPEKAAPARASRRLEARREGGPEAEAEGEAGEVNILALLRPFLTRQPPSREGTLLLAPPAHSAAPPSAVPATPSGQERAAEERAVRAYLAASGEAPSVLAAGAKLLCAVAQQKGQPWPCDLAKQMLSLAAVLCPSWKPEGEVALTLAELCTDAAEDASTGRGASFQPQQENLHTGSAQAGSDQAQTGAERKTKAALKRRGAQHPAVAKLRADCEEHLGHYLMSRLRGDADMPEELQEACAIRHQWLLGKSAELRRDFWAAGRHYSVSRELCAEAEAKHAGSWYVALPHCSGAPVISALAAQAKVDGLRAYQVLESAKAHLEGGRADQVITELGPVLLSKASVQGRGAFTTKQCILEGLQLLQDAAVSQRDVACELKCRLVALRWLLPHIPADFNNDDAHTAPVSGPPPAALRDLQTPFKAIVTQGAHALCNSALQAMTDLADFVAMHTRAGATPLLAEAIKEQSNLLQLLQWQAAVLMERAFWSLCKSLQPAANTLGRSSASKAAARQAALLAACLGFCAMQQLQVLVQPSSLDTVGAQVDMLSAVSSILTQQEVLGLQRGAFIRLALGRFSDALQLLKDLPADAVPDEAAREELKKLVDSNLARCLQLLFGVTLPHRNLDWAATAEEVAGGPSLRSPQECQEVWQYLSPYAETMEGDSKMLSRLQGVLESIQRHFRAPPAAVLEAWDPLKLLDGMPFDKTDVYSSANIDMVNQVLQQPATLHSAVASDEHASIHRNLHRLLDVLKPSLDSAVRFGDGLIMEEEGARIVDCQAQLAAFDLLYTPRSLRSWDSLASTYSEAASDILNEAARDFSVAQFRSNESLRARAELYQRRALWATLVARQVAANASMADDVPNLDEQIGNILYEDLQNAPPLCDQLSTGLDAPVRETLIKNAAQAYARAKTGLPDEWVYSCYHGKLQSKLGLPPAMWLPTMAKAEQLSVLHSGGMLEPFYQLHAQRLKLLLFNEAPNLACLTTIARYCCIEGNAQQAAAAIIDTGNPLHGQTSEDTISRVRHILILDCYSAMQFCLDTDKRYHKAAFQIGRARAAQHRTEEAVEELQDLFSSARLKFCINIWEIQGGPEAKSCLASEAVEAASEDSVGIDINDSQWGRKPASIAGNGMDETFRKFAACRRKYMLLYFKLLQTTGRFDLLLAAHAFLQSSAHWQNADIMADMAQIALVRCVVEMASRLHASRQSLSRPLSAPDSQDPAAEELDEVLLQACCTLYTEQLAGAEQPLDAGTIARVLPDIDLGSQEAAAWALGEGFQQAAQCCISRLGVQKELGKLQELLAGLRKRFKVLRSAPQESQGLAKLLAATMAHAINGSLTRLGAEPHCSRAPSVSAPNQATAPEAEPMVAAILPAHAAPPIPAPAAGMLGSSADAPAAAAPAAAPGSALPPHAVLAAAGGSTMSQAAGDQRSPATAPEIAVIAPALQGLSAHGSAWSNTLQGLGLGATSAAALAPHMPPLAIMLHCSAEHRVALLTSVIGAFATAEVQKACDSQEVFQVIPQIQAALQRLILEPMLLSRLGSAQPPPAPGAYSGDPAAASAVLAQQPAAGPSSSQPNLDEVIAPALLQAEGSHQPRLVDQQASAASSSPALIQEGSLPRHAPQQQQAPQGAFAEDSAQHQDTLQQDGPAEEPEGAGKSVVNAQQMQQSAEAREEVLQLMKHSRHLHKSAIARLPAAPEQDDLVTAGLAMIDNIMIGSYKLYMRLAGTELPPSSTLTAADAAAGYEELVKSQKQASPTKTGKGARNRPASGGEATQRMEAGGRSEAEQDREDQQPAKRRRREPSRE